MATTIFNNKRNQVDVLFTSNDTLTIAGNSSVSDIALEGQELTGAAIKQVWCSSPSGNSAYWSISRGANLVFAPDSTAYLDFAGNGLGLDVDSSGTLAVTLTNSGVGALIITLRKEYDVPDDSTY